VGETRLVAGRVMPQTAKTAPITMDVMTTIAVLLLTAGTHAVKRVENAIFVALTLRAVGKDTVMTAVAALVPMAAKGFTVATFRRP
jgi:predicted lipoprotein with Yx(FWY)xxD motif